ncbi:MAG: ribosome maturation factor RimM [Aggregatilineales bacterium]
MRPSRRNPPPYLLLGQILRPHGVHGELRIRILTDYPERIAELARVYIGDDPESTSVAAYEVDAMRIHQEYGLLKLKAFDDRSQAERLRGQFVMVDLDSAVPREEGEFFLYELLGLEVQTEDGEKLGLIVDVIETGANDVYVIESDRYGELLIPALEETILSIDFEADVMIVRLLEGLLPS